MEPVINPGRKLRTNELLDTVPVPNRAVNVVRDGDHDFVVTVPLQRPWYMKPPLSWILPFSSLRRVSLDALGREVWQNCDGKRKTERIVEMFAANHQLSFHEARLGVLQFIRDLTRRGLLVMVGTSKQEEVRG